MWANTEIIIIIIRVMKTFLSNNFLLQTKTAEQLYHEHAAKMPIIDYHCHLVPEMVASDHRFKSITELWLGEIILVRNMTGF